jgi:starch phosphorylase
MYIFGLTVDEVAALQSRYQPKEFLEKDDRLRRVIYALRSDRFSASEPGIFRPLYNILLSPGDRFLNLADFSAYAGAQQAIAKDFQEPDKWSARALMNTARTGYFSSDRTIKAYADEIWGIKSQIQEKDRW